MNYRVVCILLVVLLISSHIRTVIKEIRSIEFQSKKYEVILVVALYVLVDSLLLWQCIEIFC